MTVDPGSEPFAADLDAEAELDDLDDLDDLDVEDDEGGR